MTRHGWKDGEITVKKLKVQGKMPVHYCIPVTVATSTTAILDSYNLTTKGTAAIKPVTLLVQPPYPMSIIVQARNNGGTANTDKLTIEGYDAAGNYISEDVAIPSVAHSGTTYNNTSRAFSRIVQMTANKVSGSTDINVGYRNIIGLPYPIDAFTDILSYEYGGTYSTTNSSTMTIGTAYNTITMPTMAAGRSLNLLWMSRVQE